jgi:carbon starvation protein CstA
MKPSISTPLTWKTTFSFVTLATLLILLIGWLIKNHVLPVKTVIDYSTWVTHFIQFWIWVAVVVGLLFPGIDLQVKAYQNAIFH